MRWASCSGSCQRPTFRTPHPLTELILIRAGPPQTRCIEIGGDRSLDPSVGIAGAEPLSGWIHGGCVQSLQWTATEVCSAHGFECYPGAPASDARGAAFRRWSSGRGITLLGQRRNTFFAWFEGRLRWFRRGETLRHLGRAEAVRD